MTKLERFLEIARKGRKIRDMITLLSTREANEIARDFKSKKFYKHPDQFKGESRFKRVYFPEKDEYGDSATYEIWIINLRPQLKPTEIINLGRYISESKEMQAKEYAETSLQALKWIYECTDSGLLVPKTQVNFQCFPEGTLTTRKTRELERVLRIINPHAYSLTGKVREF